MCMNVSSTSSSVFAVNAVNIMHASHSIVNFTFPLLQSQGEPGTEGRTGTDGQTGISVGLFRLYNAHVVMSFK